MNPMLGEDDALGRAFDEAARSAAARRLGARAPE